MLSELDVRLGYGAGTGVTSVDALRDEAIWAERAGFDGDEAFAKGWLTIDADPCPVLLAALGPKMLDLAGSVAQGATVGSCGPRTIAEHIAPTITAAAERADRPEPRIVALVSVCVSDDPEGVSARGREFSQMYDAFPSYRRALDCEGVASGADLTLAGTIDDIVEGLAAYVDAGATDLRLAIAARNDNEREATCEALAASLKVR